MAVTVEDGSVVANADSYLSVADADSYFTEHGSPSEWTGATTGEKEAALKYATIWLDSNFQWYSEVYSTSQVLEWPRKAFYDSDGRAVGGENNMPQALLDATAETALEWLKESFTSAASAIRRERIGSAEVEYATTSGQKKVIGFVKKMVRKLGRPSSTNIRVVKG